jgi:hypothetical protein
MRYKLLIFCLLILTVGPVMLLMLFDINRYVLTNYSFIKGGTPSEIYRPQQIIMNPSTPDVEVLLLGGSSVREFFPGDESVSKVFSRNCGLPVLAFNAGTSNQSLADTAAIVDAVLQENARPKILLVGLTKYRLSHPWRNWNQVLEGQRLTLPVSETLLLQFGLLDAWRWRLRDKFEQIARLAPFYERAERRANSVIGQVESRHYYDRAPMSIKQKLEQTAISHTLRNASFVKYAEQNARRFADAFAPFSEMGMEVVFLFTPQSPVSRAVDINNEIIHAAVARQLEQTGVVVDLRNGSQLTEDMFYDEQHLRPAGREHLWDLSVFPLKLMQRICGIEQPQ